ncbi:hypothetical protein [Haloarcula argentinensis]|uniref:Uncharacterized protein n=1 Tax=Haloarcula argentinensis TaxID=43776 RepID=A0ABU2F7F3_HALAR|nr:hypothetical protein [Haloarcula argentinensis]MDS0256071.1 hypothetical protein [Haloarcula argentinensis]
MTAEDALRALMREGRVTAPYAADMTGYKKSYIRQKLNEMANGGDVCKVYEGLYELVEDPWEDSDAE